MVLAADFGEVDVVALMPCEKLFEIFAQRRRGFVLQEKLKGLPRFGTP
jgi:hypothetical protein